jgi:NAD(P)-dependent dehydrogenase (short-subunit alcohol dehydrogenase family)
MATRAASLSALTLPTTLWRRAFEKTVLAYCGLDILVSNAGISTSNLIEDTTLDEWDLNHGVLGTG